MELDESFDLRISRDIHDQVHAMVVHEFFHPVGHGDAEVFRPFESRRARVTIGNSNDLNRRNQMEEIE